MQLEVDIEGTIVFLVRKYKDREHLVALEFVFGMPAVMLFFTAVVSGSVKVKRGFDGAVHMGFFGVDDRRTSRVHLPSRARECRLNGEQNITTALPR